MVAARAVLPEPEGPLRSKRKRKADDRRKRDQEMS